MQMSFLFFGPAPLPRRPSVRLQERGLTGLPENPAAKNHSTELSCRPEILLRFLRRLHREPARRLPADPTESGLPESVAPAPGSSKDCSLECAAIGLILALLLPRGVEPAPGGGTTTAGPGVSTRVREDAGRDPEARRRLDLLLGVGLFTTTDSTGVPADSAGAMLSGPRVS